MNLYHSTTELPYGRRYIATLGLFDGVHLGHQHLVAATKAMAKEYGAESLVVTMDPHPLAILRPDNPLPRALTSLSQKVHHLEKLGIDHLLVLPFTWELSQLSPKEFVQPLIKVGLQGMMLGYDNRFGKRSDGETLASFDALLESLGLTIRRVSSLDLESEAVSSSRIRELIAKADFPAAEALMGRPFSIIGSVQGGRQIGRTIGFPTANIVPYDSKMTLPEVGVFVSEVRKGSEVFPAMSYYGSTPTITPVGEVMNRIEAFLFDFEGDLYGAELEIAFRKFLRPDKKFAGLYELEAQLERDAIATREFFQTHLLAL